MNRLINAVLFIVVGGALPLTFGGCRKQMPEPEAITGAQYFLLSSNEVKQLSVLASKGDKDAAFKLYSYYTFGVMDEKMGDYWLKIAADLGHEKAQLHLRAYEKEKAAEQGTVGSHPNK